MQQRGGYFAFIVNTTRNSITDTIIFSICTISFTPSHKGVLNRPRLPCIHRDYYISFHKISQVSLDKNEISRYNKSRNKVNRLERLAVEGLKNNRLSVLGGGYFTFMVNAASAIKTSAEIRSMYFISVTPFLIKGVLNRPRLPCIHQNYYITNNLFC